MLSTESKSNSTEMRGRARKRILIRYTYSSKTCFVDVITFPPSAPCPGKSGSLHVLVFQGTCGLAALASAQHAEGRQFDPGQVYAKRYSLNRLQFNCLSHVAVVGEAWVAVRRFIVAGGETLRPMFLLSCNFLSTPSVSTIAFS